MPLHTTRVRAATLGLLVLVACSTGAPEQPADASAKAPTGDGVAEPAMPAKDLVSVRVFDARGELVGPLAVPRVERSAEEWRSMLSPERYRILRASGTERPHCGTLLDNKLEGVYTCGGCGLPLFTSASKFDSGTGWPSFFQPIAPENIAEHEDRSLGMLRIEIECARCGGHLGHVFDDGPRPTGLRYCLNSESLDFTRQADVARLADPVAATGAPR